MPINRSTKCWENSTVLFGAYILISLELFFSWCHMSGMFSSFNFLGSVIFKLS